MLSQIKTAFNDAGMGVPRSLPLGELLLLITIFCGIFQLLAAFNAAGSTVIFIGLFVVGIALAQALLFGGKQPRASSVVAGAVLCPVMVLVFLLTTDELRGLGSVTAGHKAALVFANVLVFAVSGPFVGYLSGLFIAGWFYLYDYFRHRLTGVPRRYTDPIPHKQTASGHNDPTSLRVLSRLLQTINPVQPSRPLRGATIVFIWAIVGSGLFSPYLTLSYQTMFGIAIAALLAAFATGVFQLPWYMLPLAVFAAALTATPAVREIKQLDFIQQRMDGIPNWLSNVATLAMFAAAVAAAFTTTAGIGWIKLALCRFSQKAPELKISKGKRSALTVLCVVAATLGPLAAWAWLTRYQQTPRRQFAQREKVDVQYANSSLVPPPVSGASLNSGNELSDLIRLYPEPLTFLNIWDSELTDENLRPLDGRRFGYLAINGFSGGDNWGNSIAFDTINDLEVGSLRIGGLRDEGLARLAAMDGIQTVTQSLSILSDRITRFDGLEKLSSLNDLHIYSESFDGEDIDIRKPLTVQSLQLHGPLTDKGLDNLVKILPMCSQLELDGSEITEKGVRQIQDLRSLTRLTLRGEAVTDGVLEALLDSGPPALEIVLLIDTSVTYSAFDRFEKDHPKIELGRF